MQTATIDFTFPYMVGGHLAAEFDCRASAKVRQMREFLGITQQDVAGRVGLTRASIANIETGRQRVLLHDLERFAAALGTTPKAFAKFLWG